MRASSFAAPLFCLTLVACATPSAPVPSGPPPDWKLASVSMATGNNFQGTASGGQLSLTISQRSINGPVTSLSVTGGHATARHDGGREHHVDGVRGRGGQHHAEGEQGVDAEHGSGVLVRW